MSWEAIFAGLSLICFIGGGIISYWVSNISNNMKDLSESQKQLAEDLKRVEVMLPNEYAKKDDISVRFDKIDLVLERIFDRLDAKADK